MRATLPRGAFNPAKPLGSGRIIREAALPTKSKAQQRLMLAAAHSKSFAKKSGVPMSVAKDFVAADQKVGRLKKRKPGRR